MISLKRTTILGDMRTERYNMCLCGNRIYLEVVSMCLFIIIILHVGHLLRISVSAYNNGCCACVGTGMNSAGCRVSNCWKGLFVFIFEGGGGAFYILRHYMYLELLIFNLAPFARVNKPRRQ